VTRVDEDRHAKRITRVVVRVQWKSCILKEIKNGRKILLPLTRIPNMKLSLTSMILTLGRSILLVNTLR
jgi:hypothetical protein